MGLRIPGIPVVDVLPMSVVRDPDWDVEKRSIEARLCSLGVCDEVRKGAICALAHLKRVRLNNKVLAAIVTPQRLEQRQLKIKHLDLRMECSRITVTADNVLLEMVFFLSDTLPFVGILPF